MSVKGSTCYDLPVPSSQNQAEQCLIASDTPFKPEYLPAYLLFSGASTSTCQASGNLRETMGKQECSAYLPLFRDHPGFAAVLFQWESMQVLAGLGLPPHTSQPLQPDSGLGVGYLKQIVFVYMHLCFCVQCLSMCKCKEDCSQQLVCSLCSAAHSLLNAF